MTSDDEKRTIRDEFHDAVNMTAKQLEDSLKNDESKEVGQKPAIGRESTVHESGRGIVDILGTKQADLSDDDYAHMKKVAAYAARHSKQRPSGDATDTKWRYSLMSWGNDPLKK